jgi:hypothetical protein
LGLGVSATALAVVTLLTLACLAAILGELTAQLLHAS